jgi:hypothetical protein
LRGEPVTRPKASITPVAQDRRMAAAAIVSLAHIADFKS